MAPAISINLFAIVSLALFSISFSPIAANAVSLEQAHVARNLHHAHAGIAKKKRDGPSKRCKPRPSSSTPPPTSTTPPPANTPAYTPPSSPSPTDTPSTSPSPSPTSTSSSSPAPASTPVSGSGGKVGVSWSNMEETSLCNFASSNTHYVYNWKSGGYGNIVNPASCGFEYIPQCWGASDLPGCINDVQTYPTGTTVFCFNEPDQGGQSNLGVDDAVALWFQYFQGLGHQGYHLVSPACTNSPAGFDWIQQFVSKVQQQGGYMDGVAQHIYSTDINYAISFLQQFISTFSNLEIWVTEYACQDYSGNNQQLDAAGVYTYMTSLSNWMYENSRIKASFAFAYFTQSELVANNVNPANAAITDGTDEPTSLGYALLNPN